MRFAWHPQAPSQEGIGLLTAMSKSSSDQWPSSTPFTGPEPELRRDLGSDPASLRGWQWALPRAGHPPGLAKDGEVVTETASWGREQQGRQRALPVPAHGKEPLSAPLLIGSSFFLPGPPRRRGDPARAAFRPVVFQPFSPETGGESVEAGEGSQGPHPGNSIRPSPEHLRASQRRGERHRITPGRRGGEAGGQIPASCFAKGQTHTQTHTTFAVRQQTAGAAACLRGAGSLPLTAASGRRRSAPLGEETWGRLPTFLRGSSAMCPWRSSERGRSREQEWGPERERERERGRRRGARTGLAGAGSAGGAKPAGPPGPLHWSTALPISRRCTGTLPVCEPPPGAPPAIPAAPPGCAVSLEVHCPPGVRRPLRAALSSPGCTGRPSQGSLSRFSRAAGLDISAGTLVQCAP